ncbi:MAG TPA: rhodanese-like domain-containing protein [Symbiobacteriaceae bacterium]|nr:rhodanese-like domain-containing protein [Symbiobacteriaceae bacterium]
MALPNQAPEIITTAELSRRLASRTAPRIIDVREAHEFAAGHIPGAENMPLSRFAAQFRSLPKQEELVLVCRSGNRSGMAQKFLVSQGYSQTRNLVDGMLDWTGPVVRS